MSLLSNTFLHSVSPSGHSGTSNFANQMFEKNLYEAKQIMVVLYDDENTEREKLVFRGVGSIWNWFQAENLVESSLWDKNSLITAGVFELNPDPNDFYFEITATTESECDSSGFFKMNCDISTACDQLKWWLEDQNLVDLPCGIVYSKLSSPVDYTKGSWASKIQILTVEIYETVFSLEAFSGVDAYDYYNTGELVNPDSDGGTFADKLFRHPNIRSKIESADHIRFRVYNFEMTEIVSEIVFRGTNDFNSWFSGANVENSTVWDITNWSDSYQNGRFFQLPGPLQNPADKLRNFFINDYYGGCPGDRGWMVVVSRDASYVPPCDWELWWNKDSITRRGLNVEHIPPYILYATTASAQNSPQWSDGGKIDIAVEI